MPLHRRLPKRGFRNPFSIDYNEVNLSRIQAAVDAGKLDPAVPVTIEVLIAAGRLRKAARWRENSGKRRARGKAHVRGGRGVEECRGCHRRRRRIDRSVKGANRGSGGRSISSPNREAGVLPAMPQMRLSQMLARQRLITRRNWDLFDPLEDIENTIGHVRAFSSEGDTGSRQENAIKQRPRAAF